MLDSECLMSQILVGASSEKNEWKAIVWEKSWKVEENHWTRLMAVHKRYDISYKTDAATNEYM